jgi:serine/threonine protein kinase
MSVSVGRTRVGRYELGRTLGEGTFAKVKFARNVETGENVAIKILDKEKVLRHKMIAQVIRRTNRSIRPPISPCSLFISSISPHVPVHVLCFSPVPFIFCILVFLKDWCQGSSCVCLSRLSTIPFEDRRR